MLRKRWLALAATALCGLSTTSAHAQPRLLPPEPLDAPLVRPSPAPAPSGVDGAVRQAVHVRAKLEAPVALDAPPAGVPADCGDSHGGGGNLVAGGSFYWLRPYINNNAAFVTTTGIGAAAVNVNSQDFDWDYLPAAAGWIGWNSDCGVGFRGRYFHFDHDSNTHNAILDAAGATTTSITPPTGLSPLVGVPPRGFQSPGILLQDLRGVDALSVHSDLRLQTIDLEGTFAREWTRFSLVFGAGGRYIQMHQNYRASLVNAIDAANTEVSLLHSGHNFYGGGPTMSGQFAWRLGGSNVSLFAGSRASLLVGSSRQTSVFSENIVDAVNGPQNTLAISQSRDQVTMPIWEVESGLEYNRLVGRTKVFIRGGVVNHTYFDAGSASSRDGNLSLFGGQVSMGLEY